MREIIQHCLGLLFSEEKEGRREKEEEERVDT